MKILSNQQIKEGDNFTIAHEPIQSIDLMERAAGACLQWIQQRFDHTFSFTIFCGPGNNGGDGLAIARLLSGLKYPVQAYLLTTEKKYSADCAANLQRLQNAYPDIIHFVQNISDLPALSFGDIIIDALFGTGLSRGLETLPAAVVQHINQQRNTVISIDVPSGLFTDNSSVNNTVMQATYTLTFECYKLAFLLPENEKYIGGLHLLAIGWHPNYWQEVNSNYELTDQEIVKKIYRPRSIFSHKGNYGHALIFAGSYGKMGAAILCSKACLRSGAGLLTTIIPEAGYSIFQTTVPEAMCLVYHEEDEMNKIAGKANKYAALGIGPGIDTTEISLHNFKKILYWYHQPMVIDADALNLIAAHPQLLAQVPKQSIFTPHQKEFERLFGQTKNNFEQLGLLQQKAKRHNIIIILKGHYTCIACPDGNCFFNNTGNPGMATGGSGDVLTGIITGLLAQGYPPKEAAIFGVYLHGLAGDFAAAQLSQEAMLAGDIIEFMSAAFKKISTSQNPQEGETM